ncbi:MAG TPA: mobile mystery protein B [Chitinophagaceae bacterium]
MGLDLTYEDGQTPLDEDEKEGLLIKTISNRGELDEMEQLNIEAALEWTLRRKFNQEDILTEAFINGLHKRMYKNVWRWAGEFRKSNKNIGVDKYQISLELRQLLDDCRFWINNKIYSEEEIAVRFKHRIVSIHCYSNGNGRHSRLIADVIISHIFNKNVFSWGVHNLVKEGEARTKYLQALKAADSGNFELLLAFARS